MKLEDLKNVTTKPGVYLWKDKNNNIIYVGKANNLKQRMSQYLKGSLNSYKTHKLMQEVVSFETIVVSNAKEALVLERNLIKEHNPEFNILLKDDKRYPYIQITKGQKLSVDLVRRIKKQKNVFYYGPFPSGYGAMTLKKLLEREASYDKGLPIINPDPEFIETKFLKLKNILSHKEKKYIQELETKMFQAADNLQFELANDYKISIEYLKKIQEDQIVELANYKNFDVISAIEYKGLLIITIMFYRYGNLLMKEEMILDIISSSESSLIEFLNSYYENNFLPDEIILDKNYQNINFNFLNLEASLFSFPEKGIMKKMLEIANLNTNNNIEKKEQDYHNKFLIKEKQLNKLANLLKVDYPKNIIMIDNSNTNNTFPVSAIVFYQHGIKLKNKYKKFNLEVTQARKADVEYMRQAIVKYLNSKHWEKPDLILIDGAKAQVREVKKVLLNHNISIPIIGLVKNEKHTTEFLIGLNEEKINIEDKELLNFLREIQYEVDRFAKHHHNKRKNISSLEGSLLKIKGLGSKMEIKLLNQFETYSNIYNASLEELKKIVPEKIAIAIKNVIKQ